jgi:hypothetical protein
MNNVVELELNWGKGWRGGSDLSFLAKLPNLKAFELFDFHIKVIEPIHSLHELRRLGITTYCSSEIRFSEFPELERSALEWRPKAKSLFECSSLKRLFVNRYRGKDLSPFGKLVNLKHLSVLTAPIKNLAGLAPLVKLRYLRLGNMRCLSSLTEIEQLVDLELFEIRGCRHFKSIEAIGELGQLTGFDFGDCGDIDTLKPLDRLNDLQVLLFDDDTKILDGDLSPILRQKRLKLLVFRDRRHYSHRRQEICELLKIKC